MAHLASDIDVSYLRTQLAMQGKKAESALDRAFDLQQAGAPAESVEAALAEATRLQAAMVDLRQKMYGATLH
ncbi:MAG TPA: hypothetical protein VHL79_15535 [Ramlibacter sp.]|jgi:sarcosine oxidase gamma subunit|nr:hypothetical protein [Ramlibacter sp.]